MSTIESLNELGTSPPGWESGLNWEGDSGTITTHAMESPPDSRVWGHVLEKFGLDPDRYVIDGKVRHSAWEVPGHGVKHAYRANIVEKPESAVDIEDLLDQIYIDYHPADDPGTAGEASSLPCLTIVLTDTHIGKGEAEGGGTATIIDRWRKGVDYALERRDNYEAINLVFGGDLIEGYVSQGGKNIAGCDLTLSEQIRTAQHLVSWTIQRAIETDLEVHVSAVPGNHGETTRVQGVPMGDSFDVMIVKNVEQALEIAGFGDRVEFHYPAMNRGSVTYKVAGTTFVVAHGHKFKSQLKGAQDWWAGHIANDRPEKDGDVLICGHFHSALFHNWTRSRWILFCSALESESVWFANQTGATSQYGVTNFLTYAGTPYGFQIS